MDIFHNASVENFPPLLSMLTKLIFFCFICLYLAFRIFTGYRFFQVVMGMGLVVQCFQICRFLLSYLFFIYVVQIAVLGKRALKKWRYNYVLFNIRHSAASKVVFFIHVFQVHIKMEHLQWLPFQCPICSTERASDLQMREHMHSSHHKDSNRVRFLFLKFQDVILMIL